MSAPPPYPGNEPAGYPPANPGYPPANPGYPPANPGYPPADPKMGPPPAAGGYPPPQAGYGQPAGYPAPAPGQPGPGSATTVVVSQPALTVVQVFRESPVHTRCPHCQAEVITATHFETGTFTWILCVILCFVGCDLGCCLIPFCVDGCKDVIHSCPNCRQQVARWSRM